MDRNIDHKEEGLQRLETFEMCVWCRMEKSCWTEHKTKEEVLLKVDKERTFMATTRGRQR